MRIICALVLAIPLVAGEPALPPIAGDEPPAGAAAAAGGKAAPAAKDVEEAAFFTTSAGLRVAGTWNEKAQRATIQGTDCTSQVLSREAGAGWTLPAKGGVAAYRNKYEIALKNYDRAQQKVTDQAAHFEKFFGPLGFLWDILTPLDAKYPVTSATAVGRAAGVETNMSVQARESFAVLQKNRRDRLKAAKEVQDWAEKFRNGK
jgi:hypothetical protein